MADCLIGLGSNVGDRTAAIARALEILGRHSQVAVRAASRNYSTRAVGGPTGQLPFVNAAARLETGLTPPQLLAWLHETEFELGRIRAERWGPRIIDLDLLLFGALVLDEPGLTIPHPRMGYRLFVLVPAVEIAAEMLHPGIGWSLGRLVEHLRSSREYLAVTGVAGVGKTKLVTRLQSVSDCRTVTADLEEADLERLRADPDGSALQMELEFLRLRADRLAAGFAADTGGAAIVSDFWLGQGLVYARRGLDSESLSVFEDAWQAARQQVGEPKLLVLMDATPEWLSKANEPRAGATRERRDRLQSELAQSAALPGRGPLLRLDSSDFEWAVVEVSAALDAMREFPV